MSLAKNISQALQVKINERMDECAALVAPSSASIRMKHGEPLEGLEILQDGFMFSSTQPYAGGETIEVLLCNAALRVDACVVACARLNGSPYHYVVRANFNQSTPALNSLIRTELLRAQAHIH